MNILFFDEIFNGNPTVLNACLTLLESREMISGKKLPDIMIVAAANPQGMVPLTPQIKERFVWYKFEFPKEEWKKYMLKKYKMPDIVSNKLCTLIKEEDFKKQENYLSARSIDKAVNMMINEVETPYENLLLPILNTLIENKLKTPVKLNENYELAVGESISWLDMIKLIKNIKKSSNKTKKQQDVKFKLVLIDSGPNKLQTLKLVKKLTSLSLKETKDLIDGLPQSITERDKEEYLYDIMERFVNIGATVKIDKIVGI